MPGGVPVIYMRNPEMATLIREAEDECCICLSLLSDRETWKVPPCSHVMHAACAATLFWSCKAICPMCRVESTGGSGGGRGAGAGGHGSGARLWPDAGEAPLSNYFGALTGIFGWSDAGWQGMRCCKCALGTCAVRFTRAVSEGTGAALVIKDVEGAEAAIVFSRDCSDTTRAAIMESGTPDPMAVRGLLCHC